MKVGRKPMREGYLPTELVMLIVEFIASDYTDEQRQKTLWSCCLVCRQWYDIALPLLYERPQLDKGNAFQKFANLLCPPGRAARIKPSLMTLGHSPRNFASLVEHLDMGQLVHHSTKSLTAKLINRCKENLEVFRAPAASFGYGCLVPISKCENLTFLDLSLVIDKLSYLDIQQAVCELWNLHTLLLGRSTVIDGDAHGFPKFLTEFQLSGRINFDPVRDKRRMIYPYFLWPRELYDLTLYHVTPLNGRTMRALLGFPPLSYNLNQLTIVSDSTAEPEALHEIPKRLNLLSVLRVPGDLVRPSFFDTVESLAREAAARRAERAAAKSKPKAAADDDSDTDMSDIDGPSNDPPLKLLTTLILDEPPSVGSDRALGFELEDLAVRLENPEFLPDLEVVWLHPIYKDLPGREELHKTLQSRFRAKFTERLQKWRPRPDREKPDIDEAVSKHSGVKTILDEGD